MATWVECKTLVEGKPIFTNLDQVVSISEARGGSLVTYAAAEGGTIIVSNPPSEILARQKII